MTATYLELILQALWVNLMKSCLVSVCNKLLHLRENVSVEVKVQLRSLSIHNLRKIL